MKLALSPRLLLLLAAMMFVTTAGCGDAQDPGGQIVVAKTDTDDLEKSKSDLGSLPKKTGDTKPWKPPNPDREEIFEKPDPKKMIERHKTSVAAPVIELRGFVKVGQLRAVLVINGEPTSVAAGDRRGDLEIIAVKPPKVTLRRGRFQWTEALK
jgi:hypothetical protein